MCTERLEVVATPSRAFRHCLKEMNVVNVNHIPDPLLYELLEDGAEKLNTLHLPGKRIVLNGNMILIDGTHSDEGVWLESRDGNVISKAQVVYSDHSTCYFKFPELPKKMGTYVLVLSCRDGRKLDFEAKRVSRRVTER